MARVFIGSEAFAAGSVTKYDLRARYQRVLPDVYAAKGEPLTLRDRTIAAWLWSRRQGVISGVAASALHGAKWVDDDAVVEVNWPGRKSPPGVKARNETLLDDEKGSRHSIAVTSVPRTAFDLARRGPAGRAIARLDALGAATNFDADDVLEIRRERTHT